MHNFRSYYSLWLRAKNAVDFGFWHVVALFAVAAVVLGITRELLSWAWESQVLVATGLSLLAVLMTRAFVGTPLTSEVSTKLHLRSSKVGLGLSPSSADESDLLANESQHNENSLTVYEDRLTQLEEETGRIWRDMPQPPTFDADNEKRKVIVKYTRMTWDPGGIDRTMTFNFVVHNASSVRILPTLNTDGFLTFETEALHSIRWAVFWHPPFELEPDSKARLDVVVFISERLAESLAYKPQSGSFSVDFSNMLVEFTARDKANNQQSLGYISLGEKQSISCDDHIALQSIRAFVNWRKDLPDDERVPH